MWKARWIAWARLAIERRHLIVLRLGHVEEDRVALDLDELEPWRGVDHRLEQLRGVLLRVREAELVEAHEARVAADVADQEKGALRHAPILATVRRRREPPPRRRARLGSRRA